MDPDAIGRLGQKLPLSRRMVVERWQITRLSYFAEIIGFRWGIDLDLCAQ